jgi:hypothetical protein
VHDDPGGVEHPTKARLGLRRQPPGGVQEERIGLHQVLPDVGGRSSQYFLSGAADGRPHRVHYRRAGELGEQGLSGRGLQ